MLRPPTPPRFPYTTLFRSVRAGAAAGAGAGVTVSRRPKTAPTARSATAVTDTIATVRSGLGMVKLPSAAAGPSGNGRSEEHTSELQSQSNLVCRLLLEKKK